MTNYPKKEIPFEHEIDPLLKKRWSPLAFSNQKIEQEKINSLFEALRWAPSSYNEQPWRIIYATQDDKEDFQKLSSLLKDGNSWAKNAYLIMVIASVKNFSKNNDYNVNNEYDTGAGVENLFLQAVSMDLVAHEMAGFDHEKAYEVLGIPKDKVKVLAMMVVGYSGDVNDLPPDLKERQQGQKDRKPLSEIFFKGKWQ